MDISNLLAVLGSRDGGRRLWLRQLGQVDEFAVPGGLSEISTVFLVMSLGRPAKEGSAEASAPRLAIAMIKPVSPCPVKVISAMPWGVPVLGSEVRVLFVTL